MAASEQHDTAGEPTGRPWLRWIGWSALALLGLVAALVIIVALVAAVIPKPQLEAKPNPAESYDEAVARIEQLKSLDTPEVGWGTETFLQGSKVETSVVLFHGYTNNPKQFELLGKAYADAGYNVLIPRMPGHGYTELINTELSQIDAETLAAFADESIDIAAGLGDRVEVVGLSGGGTMAAWAAYNRDEVDAVVAISPLFDPLKMPEWAIRPITQLMRVLPDIYQWWDPRLKAARNVPPQAYPRYSLDSMSAFLELGYAIEDKKPQRASEIEKVWFVSNASDKSVGESFGYGVFIRRIGPIAQKLDFYEFDKALGLAHDVIDPQGTNAKDIQSIYAELYPLLGLPAEGSAASGGD